MTSITPVGNAAALTILKAMAQTSAPETSLPVAQAPGISDGSASSLAALDAITRIILNSGGTFKSTEQDDHIQSGAKATIDAGDGNNTIWGGSDSLIQTGKGDDQILVNSSNNVRSGAGNDVIWANSSNDIDTGDGHDSVFVTRKTRSGAALAMM